MTGYSSSPSQRLPCGLAQRDIPFPETSGFFTEVNFASPVDHPDICLVQAAFDLSRFDETLFASCELPAPAQLHRAVRKRRAEYFASRVLVRYALCCLGAEPYVLGNDAERAPVWPAGFSGSLSHSHQSVALLLASPANGKFLGVDCEKVMQPETAEEMQSVIVTAEEKIKLLESGLPFATALTAAFSLKESLYKALFPHLRQYMDFSAAEITHFQPDSGRVRLRLTAPFASDFPAGREFTGRVEINKEQVLSWVIDCQPTE